MPKPVDRLEQEIQAALVSIAMVVGPGKMSERAFERDSGIPQGFLAKLRKGKNRHPNAVESLGKIKALLVAKGVIARPEPERVTKEAVSAALSGQSGGGRLDLDYAGVRSADDLLAIDLRIATLGAVGDIEPKESDSCKGWSTEIRQVLELQDSHRARAELMNLVPMTADQAEEFWRLQESKAVQRLAPGESAKPPEAKA